MTVMVRTSGLRGYVELMQELGVDPSMLLRRYRIRPATLQDEEALIPLRSVMLLLEASAVVTRSPDFGLRLSNSHDISVLGPLAIAMQNAPTVAEALSYASRYLFVQSPGMALSVHERSTVVRHSVEVRFDIRVAHQPVQRQTVDLCLADLHHMLIMLAGAKYELRAVTLPHSTQGSKRIYERYFGAPVRFECAHAGLHVSQRSLDASLSSVNRTLRQISVEYLALHFEGPDQTVSARVSEALRRTQGTSLGNKIEIAALLGMHPRTLQRRLASERTSFETIREEVRKRTALRYLRETRIPLTQLAGILGLSEQSALARSCRRWFGVTPSQLRGIKPNPN